MAATVKADLTRNATSVNVSWTGTASGTLPGSAERLVVLLSMRAYAAGATRTMTAEWNGAAVTFRATSLLGTVTAQDDFHYWIGTLNNPTLDAQSLKVTASGQLLRGLHATLFFVDGLDDIVPIIVHDYQDRDVSGNSVTLNGTPARAGSVIVSANGIGDATTVTSFTPSAWTSAASGQVTATGELTIEHRYTQAASTAAVETTAQFGTSDVNRGGVLFEIQTAVSAGVGVTESVSPSDSIGAPIVAVSVGLTEALTASDSSSASIPADTPAANPPGVWTGAAASWKLPSGLDSKGGGALTVSGLSAATIKGPGATFTTASYARRTAPALGALANFAVEFWVKPTAAGQIWYAGPRGIIAGNVARIGITSSRSWQVVRGVGTAVQTAVSAANAVTYGSSYHVVVVFQSGSNILLYVNGEPVTLAMTGAAVTGALTFASDNEIALGDPTGGFIAADSLFANPFNRYSAHHLPIGTGATYAAASHPAMVSWVKKSTMVVNVGMPFGTYVVQGKSTDPLQTIKGTGFGLPTSIRLPIGFDPGAVAGSDSVVSYWNPDTGRIHDLWRFEVRADGFYAGINRTYNADELGHPDEVGERLGVSAAGVGMSFCLLRGAEINISGTAIKHALQMVMPNTGANSMLSKTTQLPAASIDDFCVTDPTNNCLGNIPYGGLFAIPPVSKGGPDLTTLGLSEAGLRLATCMRDYGIYAVDTGGNVALRADQHVSSAIRTQLVSNDLPKIYPVLKYVTNSAWTPGQTCVGGGTPIATNSAFDAP